MDLHKKFQLMKSPFVLVTYAATKISADQLSMSYHRSFNLPVTILRPFNTFGPRQSLRAAIPTIISQIILEKRIKLGNLKSTRDFTYVSDTVEGYIKTIKIINV